MEKKKIIASLDLLIIDEISMVRADLLDAVDDVLRRFRRNDQPFGGVQLLLIGDLRQLAPVVKPADWQLLKDHYDSVYFFESKALSASELVVIELDHIYRQSDSRFIDVLNKVRDNQLDQDSLTVLNERYIANFNPTEDEGYITLTTHNKSADSINAARLAVLTGKTKNFVAQIKGDFPEFTYPTRQSLALKLGAQVMFVRNDHSGQQRYYNGKIGHISHISAKSISVRCPDDEKSIVVEQVCWENIKYSFNDDNKEIDEEVIGSFEQYPLKLAWAITIHKSQGLTFDKAIIDSAAAFAHGQVYVALSRCRNLEGLVLASPVSPAGIKNDPAIDSFISEAKQSRPSLEKMRAAKIHYQQQLLLSCFDFGRLAGNVAYLLRLVRSNERVIQCSPAVAELETIKQQVQKDIFVVSENFRSQLTTIFTEGALPEADEHIRERINKAAQWFGDKWQLLAAFVDLQVEMDNKELRKKIERALGFVRLEGAVRLAGIRSCSDDFSPSRYLRAISMAEIDSQKTKPKKKKAVQYSTDDVGHPELFETLRQWRNAKAKELAVAHFQILHQKVLIQIAVCLPENTDQLAALNGVGQKTVENFGSELVALVKSYRKKHGIEAVVLPEPTGEKARGQQKKKSVVVATRDITLELFEQGKDLPAIAAHRGLAVSTIETHMSFWVEHGRVSIDRLVTPEKQEAIARQLAKTAEPGLSPVKQALGDDYSYGEIKMVVSHRQQKAAS